MLPTEPAGPPTTSCCGAEGAWTAGADKGPGSYKIIFTQEAKAPFCPCPAERKAVKAAAWVIGP